MDTLDCPSLGTLRAHLDHDDVDVTRHLDGCDGCRATIVTLAGTAGTARRVLGLLDDPADDAAPAPVPSPGHDAAPVRGRTPGGPASGAAAHTRPAPPARGRVPSRRRRLRDRAAVVGGAAGLAVLGATVGQPVVAEVLDQFRSERVEPVAVGDGSPAAVAAALEGLADVTDVQGETLQGGLDELAAAEALAGVAAPRFEGLGLGDDARVDATATTGVRIAFRSGAEVPARLRGATVDVVVPGGLAVVAADHHLALAVARPVEITATGAALEDVRAALLTEVDLPRELRDQLLGIEDWRSTLPLPVPVDPALWDAVDVDGAEGLAVGHGDGFGMVVWQADGRLHSIAGERSVEELVALVDGR